MIYIQLLKTELNIKIVDLKTTFCSKNRTKITIYVNCEFPVNVMEDLKIKLLSIGAIVTVELTDKGTGKVNRTAYFVIIILCLTHLIILFP